MADSPTVAERVATAQVIKLGREAGDPGRNESSEDFGAIEPDRLHGESVTEAPGTLPIIDFSAWQGAPPPREWLWHDLLPVRQTTLLTGAGGVGKSLAAQQLATCIALGLPFLGIETKRRSSLYLTAEDDTEELWRRQAAICEALDVPLADLAGKLYLASLAGDLDTALATFDAEHRMTLTDRWRQIAGAVEAHGIGFAALDNATDLMAGDHNEVHQVAAFVNMLTGLSIAMGGSVLILHHPNKNGDDWLGSVAWHNKVRARLILKRGEDGDPNTRLLENPKANYGPSGGKIEFRWHRGALVRDEELPQGIANQLREVSVANGENAAFLDCLRQRAREGNGRAVGPSSGPSYAPSQFEGMKEAKGYDRKALKRAMDRLFAIGRITTETFHNKTKGRQVTVIVEAPEGSPNAFPNASRTHFPNGPERAPNIPRTHTPLPTEGEGAALEAAAPSLDPAELDWGDRDEEVTDG